MKTFPSGQRWLTPRYCLFNLFSIKQGTVNAFFHVIKIKGMPVFQHHKSDCILSVRLLAIQFVNIYSLLHNILKHKQTSA